MTSRGTPAAARVGCVAVVVLLGAVVLSTGAGCAQRSDLELGTRPSTTVDGSTTTRPSTTTEQPATTTRPTTTAPPATTAPPTTLPPTTPPPPTTAPALVPGQSCTLGSHPDCIDPDRDGVGVYLLLGADCMAAFADAPEFCSDLDQDGVAGYPDSG